MRVLAIAAILSAAPAAAAPLSVVVRGGGDALAVERLEGQVADLEVTLSIEPGALEPTLDAQVVAATRLAELHGARAVVWFVPRGKGVAVAIATPADHRLFVREIPAANASAVAEAAAVAARGALRAIALGGTIGVTVAVTVAAELPAEPAPTPIRSPVDATTIEAGLGWQVALDGGADRGAHAITERTTIARGPWATSLALSFGLPLHRAAGQGVALDLARSGGVLGVARRLGSIDLGVAAGVLLYHRTTLATPDGLAPTPGASSVAFVGGLEVIWRARLWDHVGVAAEAGLDLVAGAPELAVATGGGIETVGQVRAIQGRFALWLLASLP